MRHLLICLRCSKRFTEPRDLCPCGGQLETAADQVRRLRREELAETAFSNNCVPGSIRFPPSLDDEDAAADEQHLEDVAEAIGLTKEIAYLIRQAKATRNAFERWKAAQICRVHRRDLVAAKRRVADYAVNRLFKYSGLPSTGD